MSKGPRSLRRPPMPSPGDCRRRIGHPQAPSNGADPFSTGPDPAHAPHPRIERIIDRTANAWPERGTVRLKFLPGQYVRSLRSVRIPLRRSSRPIAAWMSHQSRWRRSEPTACSDAPDARTQTHPR